MVSEQDKLKSHEEVSLATTASKVKYWPFIGLLAGLIPGLIYFFSTRDDLGLGVAYTICIGPAGILSGIIGARIGNKNKTFIWIASISFSILGAFLSFIIAAFACLFCY